MPYQVILHRRVIKRLRTIQPKHRKQIMTRLDSLGDITRPHDCVKLKSPLEGFRITIGEYRALYTINDAEQIIKVYLVIQRGEGYPD